MSDVPKNQQKISLEILKDKTAVELLTNYSELLTSLEELKMKYESLNYAYELQKTTKILYYIEEGGFNVTTARYKAEVDCEDIYNSAFETKKALEHAKTSKELFKQLISFKLKEGE